MTDVRGDRVAAVASVMACVLAGVLGWTSSSSLAAEPTWAEKMFDATSHDFGVIPVTSKVTHRFLVKNLYRETVHISGVKTTCGCSVARPSKSTLASGEVLTIDVPEVVRRVNEASKRVWDRLDL